MKITNTQPEPTDKMISTIRMTGVLLIILGLAGILLPQLLSLIIEVFLGGLMVMAGILLAHNDYQNRSSLLVQWLKPLILILAGVMLWIFPSSGIAAIILILSFYFFTDAFASFSLSYKRYPYRGWFWMTLNGILSAILAFLILIGWPQSSMIYLGIFIGISLFFDGIVLMVLGYSFSIEK